MAVVGCYIVAGALYALPAQANEKARLVLISESHAELARRLHAEAAQVGLVLVDDSGPWQSDSPRGVPERHGALGVLRIVTPSSIDLWLLPREGPTYHQLIQAQKEEGDPFAVRVIEEVRARLVELKLPAPEGPQAGASEPKPGARLPSPEKGPTPEPAPLASPSDAEGKARATRAPRPVLFEASAGVGATQAAGGMGTAVQGALAFHAILEGRWRATAQALLPVSTNTFQAPEGTARAVPYFFTAQLNYGLLNESDVFSLFGGVGAGVLVLDMKGEGTAGYLGKTDRSTVAVFLLDADAGARVTSWLSLHAALLGGSSAPRPVARFDGRPVATWGRLFVTGIIAMDFALGGVAH
jgi:hypothetical protein